MEPVTVTPELPDMVPVLGPRLSVVETVYHQNANQQPTGYPVRFSRELKSDEQVYSRRLVVGERWLPLETGWVQNPSMILIQNPNPVFQREPSPDQLAEAKGRTVEIGLVPPEDEPEHQRTNFSPPRKDTTPIAFSPVKVGEQVRLTVLPGVRFALRCKVDEVKVTVTAFPS